MSWNSMFGAEVYDQFVRERRLYQRLNALLAHRSDLEQATRILDLACGTGATTLACLEVMDARAEIVGIDASPAMIRIARSHVLDPRARFLVMQAREVRRKLPKVVDRVVCNAAFWQFPDSGQVLAGIAHLLEPGGRLVFNVPADRIGADAPVHPFQIALGRELEQWDAGRPEPLRLLSLPALKESARVAGLAIHRQERSILACRQGELMDLMTIPPLIRPLTPALTDEERTTVLERVSRRVDPDEEVPVPWHFFTFRKPDSSEPSISVFHEQGTSHDQSGGSPIATH